MQTHNDAQLPQSHVALVGVGNIALAEIQSLQQRRERGDPNSSADADGCFEPENVLTKMESEWHA